MIFSELTILNNFDRMATKSADNPTTRTWTSLAEARGIRLHTLAGKCLK